MKILGAVIGSCVHVAGVLRFLTLAEDDGHETVFLGPATPIDELIIQVKKHDPDVVGVSYRLSPASAANILVDLKQAVIKSGLETKRWILGCTAPIKPIAKKIELFEMIFTGFSTDEDSLAFLREHSRMQLKNKNPQDVMTRQAVKRPIPLIRHHFGLPSIEETTKGIAKISEASVLDVISIGPDQNAQESFFRPNEMNESLIGDGGVPIREVEDLQKLFEASRRGNYPLLRCYSGTRDLISWAKLLKDTINNAWGATPLLWYSELDGRSKRSLEEAIAENQQNHRWHAHHNIPLEINEPHHWSLRSAHDTIAVAMAYLSAYNAKSAGIRQYVAQYMMNTPLGTSPKMDLAKMLAKIELVESLHDHRFSSLRQVRPGLFSYPPDLNQGKGQLASSVYTGMMLNPHIVHVVGFCEADHAATAEDIIESCKIARRVIHDCLLGTPNPLSDSEVLRRKNELLQDAKLLIAAIHSFGKENSVNPLIEAETYVQAVKAGVLDAPHLRNNPIAKGQLRTKMIDGACIAVDSYDGNPIDEIVRLRQLGLEVAPEEALRLPYTIERFETQR
ncbi:MAG: cobalamin B12-binding domain-containing protein [Candidatus Thorarchaeota archaeon]|nr:cobalamin B12-binding domain-containing protein [Candidatus Thorarchaeota archaeon]MCK5239749.1 cobalamin B12-binding domain-containing protein [Candidatus Thorarchaeota archaeon]